MNKLRELSNEALLAGLREQLTSGHVWQASLIAYLAEVEERRLHLELACSSMWVFCVERLDMSESEAQRRITAARLVREFPGVLGYLERGDIHLCALNALRGHLTRENQEELLREATGKTTRAVEELIAARFPRPDVPARVKRRRAATHRRGRGDARRGCTTVTCDRLLRSAESPRMPDVLCRSRLHRPTIR
jgi:hypothetical protein